MSIAFVQKKTSRKWLTVAIFRKWLSRLIKDCHGLLRLKITTLTGIFSLCLVKKSKTIHQKLTFWWFRAKSCVTFDTKDLVQSFYHHQWVFLLLLHGFCLRKSLLPFFVPFLDKILDWTDSCIAKALNRFSIQRSMVYKEWFWKILLWSAWWLSVVRAWLCY